MKKLFFFFFLIVIGTNGIMAQYQPVVNYGPEHFTPLTKSFKLESTESDTAWIQFQSKDVGNWYSNEIARFDTLAEDAIPPRYWQADREIFCSGYLEGELSIVNTDLAVDSLLIKVVALDEDGYPFVNDYCYPVLGTPPTISYSAYYNAWVSTSRYRFSLTEVFPYSTFGFLFIFNPTDETATHKGVATVKLYVR